MKHEFRMSRLAEAMASVSVGRRPSTAGLGRTSSFRAGLSLDQFQWGARAVLPDVGVSKSATLTLASEKRALGSIGSRSVSEPLELAAEAGEKLGVSAGDGRGAADDGQVGAGGGIVGVGIADARHAAVLAFVGRILGGGDGCTRRGGR